VSRPSQATTESATGVHVVIVAFGAPDLLERCLEGIDAMEPITGVIVVDNSSSPDNRRICESAGVRYVDPGENLGFAAGVNRALNVLPIPDVDVLLLNPDAVIGPDVLARLASELAEHPMHACVAPAQHGPGSTTPDRVCWPFPTPWGAWLEAVGLASLLRRRFDFVIGSVLLLRGRALAELGGFDERFFLYAEETDWQRRAHLAGWSIGFCEAVQAVHVGAGTQGDRHVSELRFHTGTERYVRKWYGTVGWTAFRVASVLRGLLRAAVRRGSRRREALGLARLYASGPDRTAQRAGAVPVARSVVPDLRCQPQR
jgi:GT2 family glycosyltransferase